MRMRMLAALIALSAGGGAAACQFLLDFKEAARNDDGGSSGDASTPDASGEAGVQGDPRCGPTQGLQSGAPWPMFGRCPTHVGRAGVVGPKREKQRWRTAVPRGPLYRGPVIAADGTVYVGDTTTLYAISADGSPKWQQTYDPGRNGQWITAMAVARDGTIYVAAYGGNVLAFREDGSQKWSVAVDASDLEPSPVVHDDGALIGGGGTALFSMSSDGAVQWSIPAAFPGFDSSPALASDGRIFVLGFDAKLHALGRDGSRQWELGTGVGSRSSPAVAQDGTVLFATKREVFAVTEAGAPRWRRELVGIEEASPAIDDDTVYLSSGVAGGGGLHALRLADGVSSWNVPTSGTRYPPVIGADGVVYVGASDGLVQAVERWGEPAWSTRLPKAALGMALGADGVLYVACADGHLYAYER